MRNVMEYKKEPKKHPYKSHREYSKPASAAAVVAKENA